MSVPDRTAPPPLPIAHSVPVESLKRDEPTPVGLTLSEEQCAELARFLGIEAVHRLSFDGRIEAEGQRGWRISGRLSAAVAQACVVTLEPVEERLEAEVSRLYVPRAEAGDTDRIELTEASIDADDEDMPDPYDEAIDVAGFVVEELALALEPYPRREGVTFGGRVHAGPGVEPLTDKDMKPFSQLAALKERLERDKG